MPHDANSCDPSELDDAFIARAKGDEPRVVVSIGFLGQNYVETDPTSAADFLQRARAYWADYGIDDLTVFAYGFEHGFGAYEIRDLD